MLVMTITESYMHSDERLSCYSWDAIEAIYEDLDVNSGNTTIEYDPVAIKCDYNEEDANEIRENYSNIEEIANAETDEELLDALNYYTYARKLNNGFFLYIAF